MAIRNPQEKKFEPKNHFFHECECEQKFVNYYNFEIIKKKNVNKIKEKNTHL